MSKCPRCGSELKGRFCGSCGFDAGTVTEAGRNRENDRPQKPEAEKQARHADQRQSYPRDPKEQRQGKPVRKQPVQKKKKSPLVPILIGVCALLLVVTAVLAVVFIPLLKERRAEADEPAYAAEKTSKSKKDDPDDDPAPNLFGAGGGRLTLTTGGEQGTYYGFGTVLAGKVSDKTKTTVTAITSGGSKANIEVLSKNDAQLGFAQSDIAAYAYSGTRLFEKPDTSFSAVAAMYREHIQIVTLDPNIKTVADLKGKSVSIGAAGSGTFFNAIDVLGTYGIDADKDINPTYQSFSESVEPLQDGKIDAAFVVAGAPTASVYSLAVERQLYLLNIDDEHIDKLIARCPYYTKGVIPRSVYNTPEDVTTVAVMAVILARNDVSDTDVYNFLSGVFDHIPEITAAHTKGTELDLAFAASFAGVPYHPAAEKFYRMKSGTVEEKKADAAPDASYAACRVAMITDYGDITDQSFNQTTYEACKAYCNRRKLDFQYYKPASDSDKARIQAIEKAVSDGYDVIILPSWIFASAIVEAAPRFPQVTFIALDIYESDLTLYGMDALPANLYCACYREEIGGYLAGYAAVRLGYRKLGFLGGMAVPAVIRYGYGFVQGADAAAAELGLTDVSVKYAYANQFFGDIDITTAMDAWYSADTEVVFACGGGIFTSVGESAARFGRKVIGLDVDQAAIIDGLYGRGVTVTSAMKGLAATVNATLNQILDGTFQGGKAENLGIVSPIPEENFVQLAGSTQFSYSFTKEDYAALMAKLFSGEMTVSDNISKKAADFATVIVVEDYGNIK